MSVPQYSRNIADAGIKVKENLLKMRVTGCGPSEPAISAILDLQRLRYAREHDRNAQQRRPDIYGEILMEIPENK